MSEVAEFWAWVSEERARLEALEKARAENLRFSFSLRNEPLKAAYEEGRMEIINAILQKLRRVGA